MNKTYDTLTAKLVELLHADLQPRPKDREDLKAALAALSAVTAALIAASGEEELFDFFGRMLIAHLKRLSYDPDDIPSVH